MSTDEPEPQAGKPADSPSTDGGEQADRPPERKKLPAGWTPEHAKRKRPVPVFVEEPDPDISPSLFTDKRYETFRKQMVLAGVVAVSFFSILGVFYWFRPLLFPSELMPENVSPEPVKEVPSLNAAQLKQRELEAVRERLRAVMADRNWSEIDSISKQILQEKPTDGEAWHAQGWVLEKNRAYADAAEAYGKAYRGGFLPSSCLIKRSAMYRHLGKFNEAVEELEESVRIDREPVVTPNLLMIAQIQAGRADEVRSSIDVFEKAGIVSNADRFLLGKAALEIHEGNFPKAANSLEAFRSLVSPPLFAVLVQDSFFDPYRSNPNLIPFLVLP